MSYTHIDDLITHAAAVPADSILSRTIYDGDDCKAVLFTFAPGQELSEHTAARPAVLHFLSGEAELTLGDDALEARAGAWIHMPPALVHSVRATTQVVMLLLLL